MTPADIIFLALAVIIACFIVLVAVGATFRQLGSGPTEDATLRAGRVQRHLRRRAGVGRASITQAEAYFIFSPQIVALIWFGSHAIFVPTQPPMPIPMVVAVVIGFSALVGLAGLLVTVPLLLIYRVVRWLRRPFSGEEV